MRTDREQRLVLLRGYAVSQGGLLAEREKFPDPTAKLAHRFVVGIAQTNLPKPTAAS
jgi:hypothetical protein